MFGGDGGSRGGEGVGGDWVCRWDLADLKGPIVWSILKK
jgi:hypothetical protein